jgi:hypothetical protein
MGREAAKELIMLFAVLGLIVAGMLAFNNKFRDHEGDAERAWYYERVAPPARQPEVPQRTTR